MDIPVDARVNATDGHVGEVQSVVPDPRTGETTHMVLVSGHRLKRTEITLPLAAVDRVEGDTVYLKLDRAALKEIPAIPVTSDKEKGLVQIDLFARVFEDEGGASRAYDGLQDWNRLHALKLWHTVVLVKDKDGALQVKETRDTGVGKGGLTGAFAGALAGLVAGPVGIAAGAVVGAGAGGIIAARRDTGFSEEFFERVRNHMEPGTSAFLAIVERESVQSLNEALASVPGVVLQQTITDTVVEELLAEAEAD